MKKSFLYLLLVATLIIGFAISPGVAAASTENEFSDQLIEKVNPYIKINQNKFIIVNEEGLRSNISYSEYLQVKESLEEVNRMLKENPKLEQIDKFTFAYEITDEEIKEIAAKEGIEFDPNGGEEYDDDNTILKQGVTKLGIKWWGYEVWLSKSVVQHMLGISISACGVFLGALLPGIGWAIAIAIATYVQAHFTLKKAKAIVTGYNWKGQEKYVRLQ
ncbi:hypothetical protein [Cytobacillus horneckiae]|uniref:DUF456 domain-containing protein n=1 Tax=Cytobacillus horneckiae TaxID=549687 RepID=A0A2N0ZI40_9BACI|nr:hypothetical protein [Cytobacillus horneckiae]MEC1157994.1 hypothetical protein [Cytobacillus horneckiae]MED2937081.1 hypothetical protein [Cytobacillus horneckiae]PKG29168.1 hypothetical protein CWS20_10435 [Cytobacillus horneckiae]